MTKADELFRGANVVTGLQGRHHRQSALGPLLEGHLPFWRVAEQRKQGWLREGQRSQQLGLLGGEQRSHCPTIREAHEVHGSQLERIDERREICGMGLSRILFALVWPCHLLRGTLAVRDESVLLGKRRPLRLPEAEIDHRAVHEYDRGARPLRDVRISVPFALISCGAGGALVWAMAATPANAMMAAAAPRAREESMLTSLNRTSNCVPSAVSRQPPASTRDSVTACFPRGEPPESRRGSVGPDMRGLLGTVQTKTGMILGH